jgi:hypothetical protein
MDKIVLNGVELVNGDSTNMGVIYNNLNRKSQIFISLLKKGTHIKAPFIVCFPFYCRNKSISTYPSCLLPH